MVMTVQDNGFRKEVSPGTKGAINEALASAWLMKQGYDVFRNCSPNGIADLVAKRWEDDGVLFVDVKSEQFNPDGALSLFDGKGNKDRQIHDYRIVEKGRQFGIRYLIVRDDGYCHWYGDEDEYVNPIWQCPKTGKQFPSHGNDMSREEWYDFIYCTLENHVDKLSEDQVEFLTKLKVCFMARPRVTPHRKAVASAGSMGCHEAKRAASQSR